jgi:hypothetical protein
VAAVGAVVLARRRRGLEEVEIGALQEVGAPPGPREREGESGTETIEVRV